MGKLCFLYFLLFVPKNVKSEGHITLLPALVRWWEWPGALVIEEWKKTGSVRWEATEGSNGGAERTACEAVWKWRSTITM